jgi:UDP-N-acetylmuramate dehydrogenase
VVAQASFALEPAPSEDVRATLADMRARRHAAQPSGIKTFGSTFKNPEDPRAEGRTAGQLLDAAGCRGLEVGGARFSPKHANFVENAGEATTADVVALMAAGRRRVHERFGVVLEPEVQALGPVRWPANWDLEGEA